MFEKVLLATDLSPAHEVLIESVLELKDKGTKEVVMTWVVNVQSAGTSAGEYRERHLNMLKEKGDLFEEAGLKVQYEAPIGFPSQEICITAQKKDADLIVIGSRGERGIREMFLGSTTSNVIRMTTTPTLVERIDVDRGSFKVACSRKFESLLLATDLSDNAREAEKMAMKLAPQAKKMVIVSVAETGIMGKTEPLESMDELESMRKRFSQVCHDVTLRLEKGIASENINRAAMEEESTLIIMGKRGIGGIKELLLGSTAEAVTRRSKKPVLLVPKKED